MAVKDKREAPEGRGVRWRALLGMGALLVVLARGALAAGTLIGQANVGALPIGTAVLPTLPPSMHQITPAEYASIITGHMALSDEIAQMLMIDVSGYQLPPEQQQMIQQQHVGGALLFGSDIATGPQVQQLNSTMQHYAYYKLFIAIDQEGGSAVDRLASIVGPTPGEPEIGQRDDPAFARSVGATTAQNLETYGFNLNLAPVVDIDEPTIDNPGLAGRLYSSDPQVIARMANAYLQGLQADGKVIGTLKHFPGLGSSAINPDRGLPVVDRSQAQLDSHEFVPYRELIAQKQVRAIMVTHILLPQIDNTNPATLSQKVITGLLRDDLGFNGLIITDDLQRVRDIQPDIGQAGLLSIEAGSDILIGPLFPQDVTAIITDVTTAISAGQLTKARIDQSVERILTQKIQMGLIPLPHTKVPNPPVPGPHPTPTPTALAPKARMKLAGPPAA
jgi:beta-N-acetylhexosaminidase